MTDEKKIELSQEEKEVAAKLEAESGTESSAIDQIGDRLSSVETLLKSQTEEKEKVEDTPEEKEIDFEKISPEELAKSPDLQPNTDA